MCLLLQNDGVVAAGSIFVGRLDANIRVITYSGAV